ncbi:MAG: redoxin domain-containing protein [Haloarculaceae archaeon]
MDAGDSAPAFTAPLVRPDGGTEEASPDALLADRSVLLCFYTNDFSPDCIEEWCSFRDYQWFSTSEQVQVVGISKSRTGTHRRFIDYLELMFPLFSDRDLSVADALDVNYRTFKLVSRSRRSCFLFDEDRTIRYEWVGTKRLDPTRDTPDVYGIHEAIREEFGEPDAKTFGL